MNFPRAYMQAAAVRVQDALQGSCLRLEPTGSLRRGDPTGSSIDFICLTENPAAVAERCLRRTFQTKRDEQQLSLAMQNGLGLNLWFARFPGGDLFESTPGNFEVLQVIHTPTRQYLRDFVLHIQAAGFTLNRDQGLLTVGNRVVATTEAGIYAALNLELPLRPSNSSSARSGCSRFRIHRWLASSPTPARGPRNSPAISS